MNDNVETAERTLAPRRNRQNSMGKSTNPGEDAKTILPQLEEKLSAAKARQAEITRERNSIALAAHMGSANDRARLDKLNHDGDPLPVKSKVSTPRSYRQRPRSRRRRPP
jgi:hypothetical protein